MTEPSDPADIGTPDVPPSACNPDGNHTAAWCGHCREVYDPGPQDDPCPTCDAAATAWDTDALYRALAPGLVRYIRSLLRTWNVSDARVDAEGAVNEAFLVMIKNASVSDVMIDDPTAWLFVVARRKAAQAVRKERRIDESDRRDPAESHRSVRWSSIARRPSANDIRGTRLVLEAIADLPDRQKVAMYLRTVAGWTLEEIAAYLECAASTAGVHVHRGKVRVRERLKLDWECELACDSKLRWPAESPSDIHVVGRIGVRRRSGRPISVVLVLVGLIAGAVGLSHWLPVAFWLAGVLVLVGVLVIGGLAAAGYALWNTLSRRRASIHPARPTIRRGLG